MCTYEYSGVFLLQDLLGGLGQGEGLPRAVRSYDQDRGQDNLRLSGYGNNAFLLLGIQATVKLFTPLSIKQPTNAIITKSIYLHIS